MDTGGSYDPINDNWVDTTTIESPGDDRKGVSNIWTGSEMIIWGGFNNSYLNSGKKYSIDLDSWSDTTIVAIPRELHTAIWSGNEMIIWGGADSGTNSSDDSINSGAKYNPTTDSWAPTSMINAPSARRLHSAIWTGSEMIVWGGFGTRIDNMNYQKSGGRYDPLLDTWVATTNTNAPTGRYQHSAIWTGTDMIVWGGWDGDNDVNLKLWRTI